MTKKIQKVCKCENCGNEAEMVITCSLPEEESDTPKVHKHHHEEKEKVKGTATCKVCGNEADMWIE